MPDLENEIATLTSSGCFRVKIGRPSLATRSGCMRTMWQPLSIRADLVTGKVTAGPMSEQSQIKCLDLMGGGSLTEEKLESDDSERLPFPMAAAESDGKTEAMKSSVSLTGGASVMEATVFICEDDEGFVLWADLARCASWAVSCLYPLPEIVVLHW